LFTERPNSSGVSPSVLLALVALLFFADAARSQILPYITNVNGEDGTVVHVDEDDRENSNLRLFGTFKLFNPDTVPFYLWVSFENGGQIKHAGSGRADLPAIHLVDLELRYKNSRDQPMVKKFPNNLSNYREKRRFGGSWLGGGRSEKRGPRGRASVSDDAESDFDAEVVTYRGARGRSASEITFWKEDAQAYYEMELWGVLYAPDLKKVTVKGRYMENIRFEIELAK